MQMTEPASPSSWSRDLILVTLLLAALYGFRLGSYPLANPDEGRNAEIAREMVASGDWVTPRLDGVNYFEKPPLMYWTVASSIAMFGANEWAVRAVPALFALGGVLLAYTAARRIYGRAAGIGAALVLGSSLLYFALARFLILDMAVSVLMSASLVCFILGIREPPPATGANTWTARRRWWFYGFYASSALATLAKGLMGFLVTGAVMFLWLLIFNQWKRLRPFYLATGALLFLGVAAPWHLLVAVHNPTWFHRYVVYEHVERFLTPAASRAGPWWYFIPIVLAGLFPWSGFLAGGVRQAFRRSRAERNNNADTWFFVVWAGFIFLFFSASHSKLPPYILPVFPALAVLVGRRLASSVPGDPVRLRGGLRVFSIAAGLLASALCVAVLRPALIHNFSVEQAHALRPAAFALAAVLLLGGLLAAAAARAARGFTALCVVSTTMVLFGGILTFAAAGIERPGTKDLALFVQAHAAPSDRILHYHEFFHDFPFYAGRLVDVVGFKGELELEEDAAARASGRFMDEAAFRQLWLESGRVFAIARKTDTRGLFSDPAFTYHLLAQSEDHYLFSNKP